MRDIVPAQPEQPTPDRPPRPRAAPPKTSFKRRLAATGLAVLLALAALTAGVGTVIATVRGVSFAEWTDFPFASAFSYVSDAYRRITGAAGTSLQILQLGRDLAALLPDLLKGNRGDELLALLGRAQEQFAALGSNELVANLGARGSDLGTAAGALKDWLASADERRIAVVFGNSAEMRAGGGFIGSYAEVTLKHGAVASIAVHDITEADRASDDKTVPPVPLEPVADRWRAADANWFLSGPESGAAFLELLNRSDLYKDKPIDAAVFVAPRVVSNLLQITGPVAAGGVEVNADNFLRVIQEEVQEGQATGAASPKAVLTALVPAFTEKVTATLQSPLQVLLAIRDGALHRDLVLYARDPALQRSLDALQLTASLYPTDEGFVGGYAAVAPSTIGGDKTDAVTSEALRIREQLLPQGLVETRVEVERTHNGKEDDAWWYTEDHRSYVKVYAPLGATPTAAAGLWQRQRPSATYGKSFATYPALAAADATYRTYSAVPGVDAFEETGKQVFGFWQRTARGQGTVASVTYARQLPHELADGSTYAFVLERQPASTATYDVELFAPPGLVWQETGTNRYAFHSDDPDGRTVLALHLQSER